MSPMLEAAIGWASRGVAVFPCEKKIPLTGLGGFKNASLDATTILKMWSNHPNAQIGLPTGQKNHLFVVDVDGPAGEAAIAKLKLPETFTVETRPGRHQLWFHQPDGVTTKCDQRVFGSEEVDIRGDGGYVIGPPSIHHATGKPYRIVKDLSWAAMPSFLLQPPPNGNGHSNSLEIIPEGQRHRTLLAVGGSLWARGFSRAMILVQLQITNQRCVPPKADKELEAIADYLDKKPSGFPGRQAETAAEVHLQYYQNVEREQLKWLWPGRVPAGKLTLFVGDPGTGKSLVTIDIAARLSHGWPFPETGCPGQQGDTLILTAEDDEHDTVAPRLDAAGADSSRIARIKAVKVRLSDGAEGESAFSLERDLLKLEETLTKHGGFRLIIIDPLAAYLGGKLNSWRDSEVRAILTPLTEFATRTGIAIIGIMHLRKSEADAMLRVSGSIAFVAAARAVWGFGIDPDDEDQRVMVAVKCNLAQLEPALAYKITSEKGGASRIVWRKRTKTVDAEDVLSGNKKERRAGAEKVSEAEQWLRDQLAGGPRPQKELDAEAKESDISWRTLRRAKDRLGVESHKAGLGGSWYWELPEGVQQ